MQLVALGQLPKNIRLELIKYLFYRSRPIYCFTGESGREYHPKGTGFIVKILRRYFFICTHHQTKGYEVKDMYIPVPSRPRELFRIDQGKVLKFSEEDLLISELFHHEPENLGSIKCVDLDSEFSATIQPSDEYVEFAVVGYPLRAAELKPGKRLHIHRPLLFSSDKIIAPRHNRDSIKLDLSHIGLLQYSWASSFKDLTDGLSGSPLYSIKVEAHENKDFRFHISLMGVAYSSTKEDKTISCTQIAAVLAFLQTEFRILDN